MTPKYYKEYSLLDNIRWNFLDAQRAAKKFFIRMKYRYNGGYLCHECGVAIPIYYSHLESFANQKRFIISNYSDQLYCPHCLAGRIDAFMIAADLDDHQCDWYKENTKTVGIIGDLFGSSKNQRLAEELDLNVRFGCSWWNGHHASRRAMASALYSDKLTYSTGMSKYENGKVSMVDKNGITMERKDW
jgi:hypothetical protein